MAKWHDDGEAALNAVVGDYLDQRKSPLAFKMGLYHRGRPLEALPHGTSKLCVLVHGMACTETCWAFPDAPDVDYGARLEKEHGLTPLYVRYNTGLPTWESGRRLSDLLASVVEESPVAIEEITLIGHSLGGLVIRSACHQGDGLAWRARVKRVFYIGSPHAGAPLEKAGHIATSVLKSIDDPVVQLLGNAAELRSAAVKNMRNGDLSETGEEIALAHDIEHYLVAGTLPGAVAGFLFGDGMVRLPSATAGADTNASDEVGVFPGLHHMALSHHPDVYAWIAARCGPRSPTEPAEQRVGTTERQRRILAYLELVQDAVDVGSTAIQEAHEALVARPYDILELIPATRDTSRAVRAVQFGIMRGTYAAVRLVNQLARHAARAATAEDEDSR